MSDNLNYKKLLFLPVFLVLLSACQKQSHIESYSHCVEYYYTIDSIYVETAKVEVNGRTYHKLVIGAEDGELISEKQGEVFEKLSAMHKDYGGGHYEIIMSSNKDYPDKDIRTIEVTATDGWDDSHPAGCSVNDLCHYVANSLYPYILNGYEKVDYKGGISDFYIHTIPGINVGDAVPVDKPLSEITEEDTILIGGGLTRKLFALFIPATDSEEPRTLKVKLTDIAGTEFSADVALR